MRSEDLARVSGKDSSRVDGPAQVCARRGKARHHEKRQYDRPDTRERLRGGGAVWRVAVDGIGATAEREELSALAPRPAKVVPEGRRWGGWGGWGAKSVSVIAGAN